MNPKQTMKTLKTCLAFGLLTVLTQASPAAVMIAIESITTFPGLTPLANGNLTLTSITAGSTTYTSLTAPIVTGAGATMITYGSSLTQPADADTALSDLNLGTGTYNTLNATRYSFSSINSSTIFFVLMNSNTVPASIFAFNGGTQIGSFTPSYPTLGSLGSLDLKDSGGGQQNRTLYGFTFGASDFTFTGGFSAANMTGFGTTTNSSATDVQAAGIAVPEPATWGLLAFSLTTVLVLRRRR